MSGPRVVRAPRRTELTCKNWLSEAAFRMIQNNLDPEVAEKPENLVVYGGRGQAARSWEAFDAILDSLVNLEEDETLLVQSGKPVAVFKSHPDAPKVLIANSNLVPHWATWEHFDELAKKGLIMYGQMTAGSWIYIGTQGILQGTYETFGALAKRKGWGSLKGRFVLTAGLGGMGGAQPLAITMNEGVGLIVEVDRERAERRRAIGYVDTVVDTLEEAMTLVEQYKKMAMASMAKHVQAMLAFQRQGAEVFDYGNNIRQQAYNYGVSDAFEFPGFVPAYIRPLFCEGKGPFRWVALSGDPQDIYTTDRVIMELFPHNDHLRRWLMMAREKVPFQGLPARICWLGYGDRVKAGLKFNELVASGQVKAPIVIGRDHLDSGSVASPNRETEAMQDGSDAISDWAILNALINAVGGATWVSFHHGGGVGMGYSQHAGQVIVADGTPAAAARLERVLTTDPGMGIVRHADAGYEIAIEAAKRHGIKMPMLK